MRSFTFVATALVSSALCSAVYADNHTKTSIVIEDTTTVDIEDTATVVESNLKLKDLKKIKIDDLKINAKADQPDNIKDPLQPLNRKTYALNETIDQYIARPLATQYVKKVPEPIRLSYRSFKENLVEPRNAVYQLIQAKPVRALKTLGRFSINTLTTLGFADVAQSFGLEMEDENFGTTLGYYGVPSGPYLVLPFFGPNSFRSTLGIAVDSQGRLQKYIFDDHSFYWVDQGLRGLDARAQFLEYEGVLTGDKYAQIRDIYLQRTEFVIAEKRGLESENLFIDDDFDDNSDDADQIEE